MANYYYGMMSNEKNSLSHYGIPGQHPGIRRFQYKNGKLTPEGKRRYGVGVGLRVGVRVGIGTQSNDLTNEYPKQTSPSHGNSAGKIFGPTPSLSQRNSYKMKGYGGGGGKIPSLPEKPKMTGNNLIDTVRGAKWLYQAGNKKIKDSAIKSRNEIDPRNVRQMREVYEKQEANRKKAKNAKKNLDSVYNKLYKKYYNADKHNLLDHLYSEGGELARIIRVRKKVKNDLEYKRAKAIYDSLQ